jgi:hypothetical protein
MANAAPFPIGCTITMGVAADVPRPYDAIWDGLIQNMQAAILFAQRLLEIRGWRVGYLRRYVILDDGTARASVVILGCRRIVLRMGCD